METVFGDAYKNAMEGLFKRRYEANFAVKFNLSLLMAAFTGAAAQLRIYLPFTPVPITGQVFPALLSGMLLGRWYGGLSQALYAGIGAAGILWFAPGADMPAFSRGGVEVLTGVTGGYIVGFIVAAFFIGWFTDTFVRARSPVFQLPLMLFGVVIIYAFGAIQFSFVTGYGMGETLLKAVLPFIPGDILKALAAVAIGTAVLPRTPYGKELDTGETKVDGERKIHSAGVAITATIAVIFVGLFWIKFSSVESPFIAQMVKDTALFAGIVLLSGALFMNFLKGRKNVADSGSD
ncbi:MAG: biotin transporter BioY [Candidatus Hydrothermarchaeales archaeon]